MRGYHSLPQSPAARNATTFITEWDRYRYCRAPQGFHGSGVGYTLRFDNITVDMTQKTRCIDDSLLLDDSIEASFWHTIEFISHYADKGIVFNLNKFHFVETEMEFTGFLVTDNVVKPIERMTDAILPFPTPTSIIGARSWFGLVNLVTYAFSPTEVMVPFLELLKAKNREFYWDETLERLFQESKRVIVGKIEKCVRTFKMNTATGLAIDYSKTSISYLLFQKHSGCSGVLNMGCGDGHWKIILTGSRFTSDSESRHTPVEGEGLALAHGLESCRMFILGCSNLLLTVDHIPLVKIFSDQALQNIKNLRLLNFKEKTLMYRFQIKHRHGKLNLASDCASRYSASTPRESPAQIVNTAVKAAFTSMYGSDHKLKSITWERIVAAAATDKECTRNPKRLPQITQRPPAHSSGFLAHA